MGYSTTVNGEITITPPLTWKDMKPHYPALFRREGDDKRWRSAWGQVTEASAETEDGTLIRRECAAIVSDDEDHKHYDLTADVQEFIGLFPAHEFGGYFHVMGEDGDQWRVIVRDRVATEIQPEITWPES